MFVLSEFWRSKCNLSSDPCQNYGYLNHDCNCVCPAGTTGNLCQNKQKEYQGIQNYFKTCVVFNLRIDRYKFFPYLKRKAYESDMGMQISNLLYTGHIFEGALFRAGTSAKFQ